jgi:uncharacterized protein YdeI (BOF family)
LWSLSILFIVDDEGKRLSVRIKETIWQSVQISINQQYIHLKGVVLHDEGRVKIDLKMVSCALILNSKPPTASKYFAFIIR